MHDLYARILFDEAVAVLAMAVIAPLPQE